MKRSPQKIIEVIVLDKLSTGDYISLYFVESKNEYHTSYDHVDMMNRTKEFFAIETIEKDFNYCVLVLFYVYCDRLDNDFCNAKILSDIESVDVQYDISIYRLNKELISEIIKRGYFFDYEEKKNSAKVTVVKNKEFYKLLNY